MYGSPVGIWSAGCIIAEMILRRPLLSGRDFKDQLRLIIELVGSPGVVLHSSSWLRGLCLGQMTLA